MPRSITDKSKSNHGVLRGYNYGGILGNYLGGLECDKPHGNGEFTGQGEFTGYQYTGEWDEGIQQGQGKEVLGHLRRGSYEGQFAKGFILQGIYRHEDQRRTFNGNFGGRYGHCPQNGTATDEDGVVFEVDAAAGGGGETQAWEEDFWTRGLGWTIQPQARGAGVGEGGIRRSDLFGGWVWVVWGPGEEPRCVCVCVCVCARARVCARACAFSE
jgi:hypothetical protein